MPFFSPGKIVTLETDSGQRYTFTVERLFTPLTKKTVCEILRFERLLLENSTNRKTFNSYDVRPLSLVAVKRIRQSAWRSHGVVA